jgi:hypothetical protein
VGLTTLTVKNTIVTKDHKKPRTWTGSLYKRPKRKKMDMRFDLREIGWDGMDWIDLAQDRDQ